MYYAEIGEVHIHRLASPEPLVVATIKNVADFTKCNCKLLRTAVIRASQVVFGFARSRSDIHFCS